MGPMRDLLRRFRADERGATAIEYGMIAGGIAGVIILTVYYLGDVVMNDLWKKVADAVASVS